jgi:hypothetical protein
MIQNTQNVTYTKIIILHKITIKYIIYTIKQKHTKHATKAYKNIQIYRLIREVRAVPRLCALYPGICLKTEEKARSSLNYGSRKVIKNVNEKYNRM